MAKITVEAAAKRLGMEPDDCLKRLQEMGIMVRDQLDKIDAEVFQRVKSRLEDEKLRARTAAAETRRVGARIIRRRRVHEGAAEGEAAPEEAVAAEEHGPAAALSVEPPAPEPAVSADAPTVEAVEPARPEAALEEPPAPAEEAAAPAAEPMPAAETPSAEAEAPPTAAAKPEPRVSRPRRVAEIEALQPKKIRFHDGTREPAKILSKPTIPLEPLKAPEARPAPAAPAAPPAGLDEHKRKGRHIVDFGDRSRRKDQEREIGFMRGRKQTKKKKEIRQTEITTPKAIKRKVRIGEEIIVGELAKRVGVKSGEIIKKLLSLGSLVTINQNIDFDTAAIVAADFGFEAERSTVEEIDLFQEAASDPERLRRRPPVVTIMGHVDHGKTTLLDAIRHTDVASGEAGGITQHIGAYSVKMKDGRLITFVDTPGHESFAAMRARGAKVTDIVVLVVAADDGVMPQTAESISHAKDANVPIVVAVNKIDKENANVERITRQLMEHGLVPEQLGGETLFVNVSAKRKQGIEELLESILLQAEMMELTADPDKPSKAVILDAQLERGRGPVVDAIVVEGTLSRSDLIVADTYYGRVRMMFDDKGLQLGKVGPGMPAQVIGLNGVPRAGTTLNVVADEKTAKAITSLRAEKARAEEQKKRASVRLEDVFARAQEGTLKELKVVVKCDVHGSFEAVRDSLAKLGNETIKVRVLHAGVGAITETDINLASASEAIVIGFNVRPEAKGKELAETLGVEIKLYDVIYNLIGDVTAALEGMLEPTLEEVVNGVAEVRNVFRISRVGAVAGCYVLEGKIVRASRVRLYRDGQLVHTGSLGSLKRFKDDAKEVAAGFECGMNIEGFDDIQLGDRIESFSVIEQKATL
jgi:translation initiation factor IF-2